MCYSNYPARVQAKANAIEAWLDHDDPDVVAKGLRMLCDPEYFGTDAPREQVQALLMSEHLVFQCGVCLRLDVDPFTDTTCHDDGFVDYGIRPEIEELNMIGLPCPANWLNDPRNIEEALVAASSKTPSRWEGFTDLVIV